MNKEIDFIKENLNDEIELPASLSRENMENLLSGIKQPKRHKATVKKFVSAAVAACVVITSLVIFGKNENIIPENINETTTDSTPEEIKKPTNTHKEIISLIDKYFQKLEDSQLMSDGSYNYGITGDFYYTVTEDFDSVAVPSSPIEGMPGSNETAEESVGAAVDSDNKENSNNVGKLNLRTDGVFEADSLVIDKEYIFAKNPEGIIKIIKTEKDGTMEAVGEIKLKTEELTSFDDFEMYVYKNYLIVAYSVQLKDEKFTVKSGVCIYNIENHASPEKVKEFFQDGHTVSSRIVDGKLIFISEYGIYKQMNNCDLWIPGVYYGDEEKTFVAEDCISVTDENTPTSYTVVSKLNLENLSEKIETAAFLGVKGQTYCTKDTLYLFGAVPYIGSEIVTDFSVSSIMKINSTRTKITSVDISEKIPVITACAEIDGFLLNSWSIDEFNGKLRVAVSEDNDNVIYVLDEKLEKVGELKGIAPGEDIKSVRFMGKTAYVVTFLNTDPLFVIDFSDEINPKIVGEVKLPGFSSYLHPVGENLLVGIGVGGTETGTDGSAKISLFDVSDPQNPKEADSLVFPYSYFNIESKAYMSTGENSFMVPYSKWFFPQGAEISDVMQQKASIAGAVHVAVENGKLVLKNAYLVDGIDADRVTFINDKVFIYHMFGGIASFDMNSAEFISSIGNEGYTQYKKLEINMPANDIVFN